MTVDEIRIKHERTLSLSVKLGKNTSVAKNLGMTNLDDPSVYIYSEEDILLIVQTADEFVKTVPLLKTYLQRQATALLDELQGHHLEQEKKVPDLCTVY